MTDFSASSSEKSEEQHLKKCVVLSDCHFFLDGLAGNRHQQMKDRILELLQENDVMILNGDIFEMDFAKKNTAEKTDEAYARTRQQSLALIREFASVTHADGTKPEIVYLLGNHDDRRKWYRDVLTLATPLILGYAPDEVADAVDRDIELEAEDYQKIEARKAPLANFHVVQNDYVLGDALFVHGDLHTRGKDVIHRPLRKEASYFAENFRGVYKHLHKLVSVNDHLFNGPQKSTRQVAKMAAKNEQLEGIRHVFFGHTHERCMNVEREGRFYHNTGAFYAQDAERAFSALSFIFDTKTRTMVDLPKDESIHWDQEDYHGTVARNRINWADSILYEQAAKDGWGLGI